MTLPEADPPKSRLKTVLTVLAVVASACVLVAAGVTLVVRYNDEHSETQLTTRGLRQIGYETFDGPAGAPPSGKYFDYDLGGGGWGNDEKQVYTRDSENVRLDGSGKLVIEVHREGDTFTSARVNTRGKLDFQYGLLEARIKLPEGQGVHPSFWLLGSNIKTMGYPGCGEIDIIELVNSGDVYHNALHGPVAEDWTQQWQQGHDGNAPDNLAKDFHTYQVRRQPGVITIGIDGEQVGQYTKETMPEGADWVFDLNMYIVLNVAVGGVWPGPVAQSTAFPATMLVDWIRYWQ